MKPSERIQKAQEALRSIKPFPNVSDEAFKEIMEEDYYGELSTQSKEKK